MTFPPFSFYPDKEVHVQITTNHWNSTRRNFVHEATVSWVENVNYQNFRVRYPLITRHKWFNFATLVTSSLEGWFLLKVVWISSRLITPFLRCSPNFFFLFLKVCATAAGRNDRDTREFATVDWIAYQGAPNGGVTGNALIPEWWTGTRCIEIRLPKVSVTLCLPKS